VSGIDAVIARARHATDEGGFAERKRFTLARRNAIQKLRKFALADPYYYVLELIQAAVANGAQYIDVACEEAGLTFSYVGGHLRAEELAQIFDFLFASKERMDLAHLRSLALGINSLMLFDPDAVVIESGDGTAAGTSRMVLERGGETVDVGRASRPLAGTYVRAVKLRRSVVKKATGIYGDDDGSREHGVIETRCLATPVPILFNGVPMFGLGKHRIPGLFGFRNAMRVDEGDLYGAIGVGRPIFQVLTHGVWIQSFQHQVIPGHPIGGTICFDRLHKTVDHSAFVQDDRFKELWLRLRPHAQRLLEGKDAELQTISGLDGMEISMADLRGRLASHDRVVAIDPAVEPGSELAERARSIARAVGGEVLRVPVAYRDSLRMIAGKPLEVVQPKLESGQEFAFYTQSPARPPEGEVMLRPAELEPVELELVVRALTEARFPSPPVIEGELPQEPAEDRERRDGHAASLRARLGWTGLIRGKIHAPCDPGPYGWGLRVRLISCDRLLCERVRASPYRGLMLDLELPPTTPARLLGEADPDDPAALGRQVIDHFVISAAPTFRKELDRAIASLSVGTIDAETPAARLALWVLSRVAIARLRGSRPGRLSPGLAFSMIEEVPGLDPLGLGILRTHAGTTVSLRDLSLSSDETGGLVYGTVPDVEPDLEGLDLRRILVLDRASERLLVNLIGDASYVRVDARDILANHGGVLCRDVAVGLRDYPDFPLLVEGENIHERVAAMDESTRDAAVCDLLAQLVDLFLGRKPAAPDGSDAEAFWNWEEHRRNAARHLQWYVSRQMALGDPGGIGKGELGRLPLFLDLDGSAHSARDLADRLADGAPILVHHGHALGDAELGLLTQAADGGGGEPDPDFDSLAASPFLFGLLRAWGRERVEVAFDFDLDDGEAANNPMTPGEAFLLKEQIRDELISGLIGVPSRAPARPRIELREPGGGAVHGIADVAREYGIVGSLMLSRPIWDEQQIESCYQRIVAAGERLLGRLIESVPTYEPASEAFDTAVRTLLHHAGEHLRLWGDAFGGVSGSIQTPLATRIMSLPLFDTGRSTPVSAGELMEAWCRTLTAGEVPRPWGEVLRKGTNPLLSGWLHEHLCQGRVLRASVGDPGTLPRGGDHLEGDVVGSSDAVPATAQQRLASRLESWLDALRPDPRSGSTPRPWTRRPTRIWIRDAVQAEELGIDLVAGDDRRLDAHGGHPLIEEALRGGPDSDRAHAWLLLAIYAHLNAALHPVTNDHEKSFQLAVLQALQRGELADAASSHATV
jgi:hypothetical protein